MESQNVYNINVMIQQRLTYLFNSYYKNTISDQNREATLGTIDHDKQCKKNNSLLSHLWGSSLLKNKAENTVKTDERLFSAMQQLATQERRANKKMYHLTIFIRIATLAVVTLFTCLVYYSYGAIQPKALALFSKQDIALLQDKLVKKNKRSTGIQPDLITNEKGFNPVVPKSKNTLVVIAHRGNHVAKAENSLASIEEAIQVGADYVEIDVRTSKDGYLFLHHNETIDLPNRGKVKVRDLTWTELTKVPLIGKDGKSYPISSLREALMLCKGRINIYLDFKDADVLPVFQEIRDTKMEDNVLVYINDLENYSVWRTVAPQMPLIGAFPPAIKTKTEIEAFQQQMNWQVLDGVQDSVTISLLEQVGTPVFLDAQGRDEDEDKWLRVINKGVKGIQTDKPEALIEFLKKHKLRDDTK